MPAGATTQSPLERAAHTPTGACALSALSPQKNIKKLADFADLSSDELIGGFDEIKGKKIRVDGYLEEFSLSRDEADQLIMSAREIVFK